MKKKDREREKEHWRFRETSLPPRADIGGDNNNWSNRPYRCWINKFYQVILYVQPPMDEDVDFKVAQLSIKLHTRNIVTEWRDLQRIKDVILGTEVEAVQLFPRADRLIDTCNQYHLWALPPGRVFPFGYFLGRALDTDPEIQAAAAKIDEQLQATPGYGQTAQHPRKAHQTDQGLPPVGLAGPWWELGN